MAAIDRTRARTLAVLASVGLLLCARPAAPCTVDYVYVDANEGGSSGGHTALRFGDETYHFQHHRPGVLRLHRDDWEHFLYHYAMLENRTVHVSRIAAADGTCALLRDRFSAHRLIQEKQFDVLDALRADQTLLELLLARRRSGGEHRDDGMPLRAVGFFFPDGAAPTAAATDPGLVALRARVQQRFGADFIRRRRAEVEDSLVHLVPDDPDRADPPLAEDVYPVVPESFSKRYGDLMVALMALRVLDAAPALAPGTSFALPADEAGLDAGDLRTLRAFSGRLAAQLTRLVASDRPDWGFALLVGMARLVALGQSTELGRLVLLDAFPPAHEEIDRATVERHREVMPELVDEAREDVERARARLRAADEPGEAEFADLEAAGNRLLAVWSAASRGEALRVHPGRLLPSREAVRSDLTVPALNEAELVTALAGAGERAAAYAERLQRLYAYNLVTGNCVSALFRGINGAFVAGASADEEATGEHVRTESRLRLGGYVDTAWSPNFIPFVSARAVERAYDVTETEEFPSYRKARLAALYRREAPLRVYLREANVITSTLYRRNPDDSVFVLFTDDAVLPRPLFGAVNLMAGVGAGALGLVLAPLDGGRLLLSGLRGALFSLPELAFFNIRKGSFEYVGREERVRLAGRVAPGPRAGSVDFVLPPLLQ